MDEYDRIRGAVAEVRPDLLATFDEGGFESRPVTDLSDFLEEHFPLAEGWARQFVSGAADIIRDWAKPVCGPEGQQ